MGYYKVIEAFSTWVIPFHELGENDSTHVVLLVGFGRFMQYHT
jgi:hypothetical protein